jgi:hypothetical protein
MNGAIEMSQPVRNPMGGILEVYIKNFVQRFSNKLNNIGFRALFFALWGRGSLTP